MINLKIYHHNKVAPRNRAEIEAINYMKLFDGSQLTIEEAHQKVTEFVQLLPKKYGTVDISDLWIFARFMVFPNAVERAFSLSGRGRGTSTFHIKEINARDQSNGYQLVNFNAIT